MISNNMSTFVKVPMERVGALIGPGGKIKQIIEERSTARLNIDSSTGDVEISDPRDPLMAVRAAEVIKAIGRGFSPEKALLLFDDELMMLDIMDLSQAATNPNDLKRLMGRIIGKKGKSREIFEKMTGCRISVMGKTASLLGHPDQNLIARTGIEMLIKGAPHGPVFSYLEKKHRELKESRW